MKTSSSLFEAYLKCPTKCWRRAQGEVGDDNTYATWVRTQTDSYASEVAKHLVSNMTSPEPVATAPDIAGLKTAQWRLALEVAAESQMESCTWESRLHAVERVPSEGRGNGAQFIPIRFIHRNKLTQDDKLLLAFDAFVLSQALGRDIATGKIIHGDLRNCARQSAANSQEQPADEPTDTAPETTPAAPSQAQPCVTKVKTSALAGEVRKRLGKITALLASPAPPDLVLNRHCAECEFQARCRKIAVEKDDLSLLAGMSAKERQKLRNKGIFTVTQLSYTFRPRRTPKRAKNPAKPRYLALQALAIRENTIYFHGTPTLPQSRIQVYLDIEGLPDRGFYYLLGILVVTDGHETFQSFWADTQAEEPTIFAQFVETVGQLKDFRVFHFGDYDTAALKHMKARLSEAHQKQLDVILGKCTNVLSAIYPHVYFPIYSNSLKDIGRFIAADCPTNDTTGLHSIVWRSEWEAKSELDLKARLIDYNRTDCVLLNRLSDSMVRRTSNDGLKEAGIKVDFTQEMINERPRWQMFAPRKYTLQDMQGISKCGYFDYQREKVLVRTHRQFKVINRKHRKWKKTNLRPNQVIVFENKRCPECRSRNITIVREMSRVLVDLKFSRKGVKKWIIDFRAKRYHCSKCKAYFSSRERKGSPRKYGHGILCWALYLNIGYGLNMSRVAKMFGELFRVFLDVDALFLCRRYAVDYYESLYEELLRCILREPVIHVDETTVHLSRGQKGYVWVLTSMDKVYYFYRPTREGEFLEEMLVSFSGVLVSDFYTAYDSLPCKQQKCLVHLVRDIDDDLLKNPLDVEYKSIATEFGSLLRAIVETVDRYGLKKRHLHKHKREVLRFLDSVASRKLVSELALKYQKRFQKSGSKMFTFLDHDGVPWNNNNAEHAIKRFAKYRRDANGKFTEASLREYLVLASVLETCEFNNVSVLDFLLSKETTLSGLFKMAGRKTEPFSQMASAQTSQAAGLLVNAGLESDGQP